MRHGFVTTDVLLIAWTGFLLARVVPGILKLRKGGAAGGTRHGMARGRGDGARRDGHDGGWPVAADA